MTKKKKNKTLLGFSFVEVLGHKIRIIETEDNNELLLGSNLTYGQFRPLDMEIIISTNQGILSVNQTFYHELLHAIDWIMHNEEYKYDEEVVNVLARGLATVRMS